jgi:nucleotide-binding universal stress UspA family protein
MKTVVVPIDFSPTSLNAATYAVKMLAGSYDTNLILYHMYEKKDEEEAANKELSRLKRELSEGSPLRMETLAVHGDDLISEIERVAHHRYASLVIMGITGRTALEQVFVGSNTLKLIDKNIVPVLIIPPAASFRQIKNVALASDFKDVRITTPSVPIKSVLDLFHPALHIVNVDSEHYVSITAEYQRERAIMEEMFSNYNPEFYFIGRYDFYEAIEQFTKDKNIDVLITIPRQHSFFNGIFKSGHHTKKLVYHSHVPVLAVHE